MKKLREFNIQKVKETGESAKKTVWQVLVDRWQNVHWIQRVIVNEQILHQTIKDKTLWLPTPRKQISQIDR